MQIIQSIQNRIYRSGVNRVMLDYDLADSYEVLVTKALTRAIRN